MASHPPVEPTTDSGAIIELDKEIDGDEIGSRNYRFCKIGEPIPIKSNNAGFDPQCLPSQPLAVSERFRLLFVAHPEGFCVARTQDAMASAEEIKEKQTGPSIQDLSLVDVSIGKVSILALSSDDSLLAAIMASHIHFFAVSALLHKEQKPSYSVSLDDSICIKDMRWARNVAKVYLIHSTNGKLYHGSGQAPPICMMEDVDSVDWSVKGNSIAVGKKNTVSILTSKFKEQIRFFLRFHSVIGDSDFDQVIKVDCIRWIRPDCIAVGCFQLNEDGEEENYVVQLITSRDRRITDAASKPIVVSFNNVFMDFCSDAVPARNGPHMFLSYLDLYGLAFIANRNLSRNVGLFCWSLDSGKNEAAMVEILNDAWTLYIDSQGNDEENVIVGLSVDKVSQNENVRLMLGDEETEVPPCCVILCLTIDGKISLFHFASAASALVPPEGFASDEEDDTSPVSMRHEPPLVSSAGGEDSRKSTFPMSESCELAKRELENTGSKVTITNDLSPSCHVDVSSREQTAIENTGQFCVSSQAVKMHDPKKALTVVPSQDSNPETQPDLKQSTGIFSGKVVGDFSHPPASSYQLSGRNVQPSDVSSREQTAIENTGQLCVSSQAVKMHDPKNALTVVPSQDSNPETQPDLKQSTVIFSGKVVGDFSHPPASSYQLSGRNVQPSGKVPPINSPSGWSLTRSTAKVDASKISDGRFLSVLSGEVGRSDEQALQSAGGVLLCPTDLKEKAKPSVALTSYGQTASTPQGNRNFLPAYPGKAPLGESVASGKPCQSELKKELNVASSPTGLPYSVQNASKQFGNVEEMAKKMDILLERIEGMGGFRDASITSQTNSVVVLEEGIWALSERCKRLRGLMDEQLREVQLLLDKTVQVLVWKVYMEGIFKQATDSRYWELWNRQKLSSELELKKKCILELNQELTNKLIELERHFNSLEFSKFGEDAELQRNHRVLQNWHGQSRQIQSLHSLHNTMNAQLAAAEQLSGCLSKQMAALSISGKHDNKKKLFESIGLSYAGDTAKSPARSRSFSTPSNKEHLITSGSIAAKEQSRRYQASFATSYEPETARRRRDSLNHSWASFEPPKTTVRRMLKEDYEKGSTNRSLLNNDKKYLCQPEKKPEVALSSHLNIPGLASNYFKSEGTAEIQAKQSIESPSTSLYQRSAGLLDHGTHLPSTRTLPAMSQQSVMETRMTQNSELGALKLSDEKSKGRLPCTGKNDSFAASESIFVPQSDTGYHPLPFMSTQLPEWSLASTSDFTDSLDHSKIGFTQSTKSDQKNTQIASEIQSFDSELPVPPASTFSACPNLSEKGLLSRSSEKPSWLNDGLSASLPAQSSSMLSSSNVPSLSSFVSKPNPSTLFPATPSSSGSTVAAKQEVSQSRKSDPSTLNFASTLPLSTHEGNLSSISATLSIIKAESSTSLSHPSIGMHGFKTELISQTETSVSNMPSKVDRDVQIQTSVSQAGLGISTSDLKIGPLSLSTPSESSTNSKSGSQIDLGGSSQSSGVVTSAIKLELSSATQALSPVAQASEGIVGSVKNAVLESSHEEEMDEEDPEIDQTTEFALGNLGGFGIGSTPSSTAPKPNPFGVADPNRNATFANSPYVMSAPSGELFRPASFSFQSPQPPAPSQPTNAISFSGGFNSGSPGQVSAVSGFGQPAQIGAGQQALGSALGTFGQSRQLGAGLPGSNAASGGSFGTGFVGISTGGFGGGFTYASSGGGFATGGGGFAAAATSGGGFAVAASGGGGFAGVASGAGGATAGAIPGGGFGAFGNQQGSGGFSAFSGGSGIARPPSKLFTQMRK